MKKDKVTKRLAEVLDEKGYSYVHLKNVHTYVDMLAQRKGKKLMIKVAHNIDSIRKEDLNSLHKASMFMGFDSIVVGLVSNNNKLTENVVYNRFLTKCVSLKSLESNYFEPAYKASKSIGVKVKVDALRLKQLRKLANISIEKLAKESGVSKDVIYNHEKSDAYASLNTVSKLEKALKGTIKSDLTDTDSSENKIKSKILAKTGIESISLPKSPFDVVAKGRNYYEISYEANFRTIVKRATIFRSIKDSFENNYPFFLSRSKNGEINGIPILSRDKLSRITSEEELVNLIY